MPTPTEGIDTTIDRVQLIWSEMSSLQETGGTYYIVSYEVEMKPIGGSVWTSIVGGSVNYQLLSYTKVGLVTGTDYLFRVRASNSFGWGPWSNHVTIRADEVPAQITSLQTSIQTIYVRIDWSKPSTDNGSPILRYKVMI